MPWRGAFSDVGDVMKARSSSGVSRRFLGNLLGGASLAAFVSGQASASAIQTTVRTTDQAPVEPTRLVSRETLRPEILGTTGIVAAGRHYAVAAGTRILQAGGNAFDAGVAAVFAAAVTEISHFGLGGEAPAIVYSASDQTVKVISGQGPAPKAATPDYFRPAGVIPGNGPNGGTVPAVVDAMALTLARYGTMSLEAVLQPAIELADGFPMYGMLRDVLASQQRSSSRWAGSRRAYYPEGRIPDVGEVFKQPDLARTLRALATGEREALSRGLGRDAAIAAGRDVFYKGDIARRIAASVQADGGLLSYDDLASYSGRIEEPKTTRFYGYDVYKCGFWSQGPALLMALNILQARDIKQYPNLSDPYLHTVTEAIKLAFDDRNAYFGDPLFASVPEAGLLSSAYAASRAAQIGETASRVHNIGDPYAFQRGPARKPPRFTPHELTATPTPTADTTAIEVVDRQGNLFSCTPSSGWLLGGAYVAGDTGVPLSNRMSVFDLDADSPNVLVGGKRPRTTLTPTIVLKDGKPFLAIGTPGGDNQDQQILVVLLNILVHGLPIQQAIEAPRINSEHFHSSFAIKRARPGLLEVEDRVTPEVRAALAARGHELNVVGPYAVSTGIVAAGVDPVHGTLRGGADVRRERYVFGW